MIQIKLLNGNNIITIESPGKAPIKSSSGLVFYSPIDLVCAALGSCIGKNIVIFFQQEKMDVSLLEEITVQYLDEKIQCRLVYSDSISQEILKSLRIKLLNCEIFSNLQNAFEIELNFIQSKLSPKELIRDKWIKPCCGGK